jgi:hypothetical protein
VAAALAEYSASMGLQVPDQVSPLQPVERVRGSRMTVASPTS